MKTLEIQITDLETGRTIKETITGKSTNEVNEKLKQAYNKCFVEVKEVVGVPKKLSVGQSFNLFLADYRAKQNT